MSSYKALFAQNIPSDLICARGKRPKEKGCRDGENPFLGCMLPLSPRETRLCLLGCFCYPSTQLHSRLLLRFIPPCAENGTLLIYWFAIFQMTSFSVFSHPFSLCTSLPLNSHLSHLHFSALWNGNNTFQLPLSAVRISCLLTPSPRHH